MPRTKNRKTAEVVVHTLPELIEAGWQDFKDFNESDALDKAQIPEEDVSTDFRETLLAILRNEPGITKAIFGAGFMFAMQMFSEITKVVPDEHDLEHIAQHHRNDPKIPRA